MRWADSTDCKGIHPDRLGMANSTNPGVGRCASLPPHQPPKLGEVKYPSKLSRHLQARTTFFSFFLNLYLSAQSPLSPFPSTCYFCSWKRGLVFSFALCQKTEWVKKFTSSLYSPSSEVYDSMLSRSFSSPVNDLLFSACFLKWTFIHLDLGSFPPRLFLTDDTHSWCLWHLFNWRYFLFFLMIRIMTAECSSVYYSISLFS